eukprot:15359263-Ditylum_brightwellii.AAC.1
MGTFITCTNVNASKKEAYGWVLYSYASLTSMTNIVEEIQQYNGGVLVDVNPQNVHFKYGNRELSTCTLVISDPREDKPTLKD